MSHQDAQHIGTNLQALKAVFELVVPSDLQNYSRHGNARLPSNFLATVAILCWGWSSPETLEQRMWKANRVAQRLIGMKHSITRQGLMKALSTVGDELIEWITNHLVRQMSSWRRRWTTDGKVNLVVDGSKFVAPRTVANQEYFAANANKRSKQYARKSDLSKASTVQLLATVFWHLGTGMPFRWRVAKSTGSERRDVMSMLNQLPTNARLIGDAEYVGYPLWSAIVESKRSFLFRVGSNVTLLKNLGRLRFKNGFVYYWPESAMRKSRKPLVLRLIKLHGKSSPIYLVTNELSLTDDLACDLYRQRWEIEVFFRSVKQACQRSKLRCGTPQNVTTELNWTLLGIWAAMFVGKKQLQKAKAPIKRLSPIKVMRSFYQCVDAIALAARHSTHLLQSLAIAVIADESKRITSKASRNYPLKKRTKQCKPPKLKEPTPLQRKLAKQYEAETRYQR